jgi:hypothetical protein
LQLLCELLLYLVGQCSSLEGVALQLQLLLLQGGLLLSQLLLQLLEL